MEEDVEIITKYLDKHERQYVSEEKNKLLTAIEKTLYQLGQDERVIEAMAEMLFAYRYVFLPLEDCTSEEQIIDYFRKKCG